MYTRKHRTGPGALSRGPVSLMTPCPLERGPYTARAEPQCQIITSAAFESPWQDHRLIVPEPG